MKIEDTGCWLGLVGSETAALEDFYCVPVIVAVKLKVVRLPVFVAAVKVNVA